MNHLNFYLLSFLATVARDAFQSPSQNYKTYNIYITYNQALTGRTIKCFMFEIIISEALCTSNVCLSYFTSEMMVYLSTFFPVASRGSTDCPMRAQPLPKTALFCCLCDRNVYECKLTA